MCPCHGPCICLKEHLELEGAREQAGVALTMSVISKSELKKTAYPYVQSCTSCMFSHIRRDLASRRQTQKGRCIRPKKVEGSARGARSGMGQAQMGSLGSPAPQASPERRLLAPALSMLLAVSLLQM